jgi:hypothetical protein
MISFISKLGIAVVFALLARILCRDSWRVAIITGVGGASIFVCYAAAFLITDRLISQAK